MSAAKDVKVPQCARIVFLECMNVKPDERVLIVTDTETRAVGETLFGGALQLGLNASLLVMLPTGTPGAEPPAHVAAAMKNSDVVLCPTLHSLTHTRARKEACSAGARIATMPAIVPQMLDGGALTADYREIARLSDAVAEKLSDAQQATIVSAGCTLEMSLGGRNAISSNGSYHTPGSGGNLPTGEAYIAPVEGTANGVLVVDGSIAGIGTVEGPLEITIEDGYAVRFKGADAERLQNALGPLRAAGNVAELGIGTNNRARLWGNVLEDEKVYGTVHVAFGSNATFGGTVDAGVHIDCVLTSPLLRLDGRTVIQDGRLLL
ncbi:MAG: aminopeptidase [Spirochaetaceae bacterium]|nr:MAG: aminopeptidase [Spirochaetaceae bacterium]